MRRAVAPSSSGACRSARSRAKHGARVGAGWSERRAASAGYDQRGQARRSDHARHVIRLLVRAVVYGARSAPRSLKPDRVAQSERSHAARMRELAPVACPSDVPSAQRAREWLSGIRAPARSALSSPQRYAVAMVRHGLERHELRSRRGRRPTTEHTRRRFGRAPALPHAHDVRALDGTTGRSRSKTRRGRSKPSRRVASELGSLCGGAIRGA